MRRIGPRLLPVLPHAACVAALLASGCEGSAPASTAPPGRPVMAAHDWAGSREPPPHAADPVSLDVPRGTWVLHVGDSFVHASLQQNLRPRFEATGATYVVYATNATYTTTWANDPKLDEWLERRPSLVLVTLGANEVDMPVPREHAAAVDQLVRKIAAASTSCVWITPPMWKRDTGILQVIHDHRGSCLFFDSDDALGGMTAAERQEDHIHPNKRGGARWTETLWGWLADHRDPARPGWALTPFEHRS